jgi:hypothetical protein
MAKRVSKGWRRVFLRVLERTGNARMAAREARIDRSTAYSARHRDARFAESWEAARAKAREGGGKALTPALPPSGRGGSKRPLVLRFSKREGAQLVAAGPGRFSDAAWARFKAALEETGNVKAAAAKAGISTEALYYRRKKYPLIEAEWAEAREAGCRRVSLMLIEAAEAALDPETDCEALGLPKVGVAEALAILRAHRFLEAGAPSHVAARAEARARAQAIEDMPIEAVREEVMRRIAAIRAHRERGGADGES